jgi:hypothetical protein
MPARANRLNAVRGGLAQSFAGIGETGPGGFRASA